MLDSSCILPAFAVFSLLCGLHARIDVYRAFVRGAQEGLSALKEMVPYLCAVFMAVQLLRRTGVLDGLEARLAPLLGALGIPAEAGSVVLLRPLSGSAALAAVRDVMGHCGADSRAARFACVISGASETMLFTASLYLGAAGVRSPGRIWAAACAAYAAGIAAAALLAA